MKFLDEQERQTFEQNKPQALQADIWMISGCEDRQTSADVSNTATFQLPDPAGRAGGACTATLLNVLYEDEKAPCEDISFTQVMEKMRVILRQKGFSQIPQLSSTRPINMDDKFKIVPDDLPGTRRAVLIGINYRGQKGELRGCHNDVFNMVSKETEVSTGDTKSIDCVNVNHNVSLLFSSTTIFKTIMDFKMPILPYWWMMVIIYNRPNPISSLPSTMLFDKVEREIPSFFIIRVMVRRFVIRVVMRMMDMTRQWYQWIVRVLG
jgi:Caspase domain